MAEEAKKSTRKSKSVGEKDTAKPVLKRTVSSVKKEITKPAASEKQSLKQGDVVKDAEGVEYIFVRPARKSRIVVIQKDTNIEVVIDKSLILK